MTMAPARFGLVAEKRYAKDECKECFHENRVGRGGALSRLDALNKARSGLRAAF